MILRGIKFGAAALAVSTLVACGGGSGGSSNFVGGGSSSGVKSGGVAGPLDALQGPLSDMVIAPLVDATDGTPLSPVLGCLDEAVATDLLDIVDSVALAAEQGASSGDPTAALQSAAENLQASLLGFAENAAAMLQAVAGGPGCGEAGNGAAPSLPGLPSLPSTGTPLDDVLAALTNLGDLAGNVPGVGGGASAFPSLSGAASNGGVPGLSELAAAVAQGVAEFNNAYTLFEQQVPEVVNAPVFGGVLSLVNESVNQLDDVFDAVATGNPAELGHEVSGLVSTVLDVVLTEVLPVDLLEQGLGVESPISGPLSQGTDLLGGGLASGIEQLLSFIPGSDALPADPFGMGGSPLDLVLGPLTDAIAGGSAPSIPGLPSGGSPLDLLPTDMILGPLLGLLGMEEPTDVLSFTGPVLNGLLPITQSLLGTLAGDGPLGGVGGPGGDLLSPVVDALEPVQGALDQTGLTGSLSGVVTGALNQILGLVL